MLHLESLKMKGAKAKMIDIVFFRYNGWNLSQIKKKIKHFFLVLKIYLGFMKLTIFENFGRR